MTGRMLRLIVVAFAAVVLVGCSGDAFRPASPPLAWTVGFWFWNGSSSSAAVSEPVDVLYLQAGTVRRNLALDRDPWNIFGELPEHIPPARQYWLVYRFVEAGVPSPKVLPKLHEAISDQVSLARESKLTIAGIQLDIDAPTGRLSEYAGFLRQVRATLPSNLQLSITALLDWFRPGTSIAEVVQQTDEFVPQFYDVGDRISPEVIATPVDAKKWGPAFEGLRKTYRIGVSSFGRARFVTSHSAAAFRQSSVVPDISPLNLARLPDVTRTHETLPTGELRLIYEVVKPLLIRWHTLAAGDRFEFTMPTIASMRAGVEGARAMGPHCAGVLFFRWPSVREIVTAQPDQALRAAGVLQRPPSLRLIQQDKGCAAVRCTDLFLANAEPFSPEPRLYSIRSSVSLEYFLPSETAGARMAGPADIELSFPPFLGQSQLYIGRAVTRETSNYRIEKSAQ